MEKEGSTDDERRFPPKTLHEMIGIERGKISFGLNDRIELLKCALRLDDLVCRVSDPLNRAKVESILSSLERELGIHISVEEGLEGGGGREREEVDLGNDTHLNEITRHEDEEEREWKTMTKEEKDRRIEIVISQTGWTEELARAALERHSGDVVHAILK